MSINPEDIRLRSLVVDDAERISFLLNNKNVWDNLRDYVPFPYSKIDAQEFIAHSSKPDSNIFAIVFKNEFCGVISLEQLKDVYRLSAEIGYWIGEPFWGKGIASQAVKLITDFGFRELPLERIFASVFEHNKASMRVLEKNGYRLESIAKNAVIKNKVISNQYTYAILKT